MTSEMLYPSMSGAELERRWGGVWEAMDRRGLDALVVYGDSSGNGVNLANVMYLTGYKDPLFAYVVVARGRQPALLISNPLYLPTAERMAKAGSIGAVGWQPGISLVDALKEAGVSGGHIGLTGVRGIQKSTLPHEHVRDMAEGLPGAVFEDTTDLLQHLRRTKSEEEVGFLRKGARLTDDTVVALAREARAGMSEHELAGIVYRAGCGGGGEAVTTFIGSTPMAAPDLLFPRQFPSLRRIRPGDVVMTELSTGYGGYSGQVHRPLVLGTPTPRYQALFDVAAEIYERVLGALGPGATDHDVRAAAAPVIKRSKVWTMDALLHGWGLGLEAPRLDVTETATIQRPQEPIEFSPGMAMVLQPHVLSADQRCGLQLGSLVVITGAGAEALQQFPMEWVRVEA